MEECTGENCQYYTIVNEGKNVNIAEKGDGKDQIVYLTIKKTEEPETTENSVDTNKMQDNTLSLSSFESNINIITLEDGRVFMTTTCEDEHFESIEPHLITSNYSEQDDDIKEGESLNDTNANIKIVQLVDNSSQMIEMIYCDQSMPQTDKNKAKSFICLYEGCGKMYSVLHHLNVHMRNHLDTKPYVCTEEGCDKTFSTNYSLKAHIRTHTGEKPYGCTICQKSFKTSGDLQKHTRIHTGEKPFLCPIEGCGKSFTTSNIRKVHIRSHTGERPYSCSYPNCGKAFSSSTNYKNHVRIHSGEKPYVCNVKGCGKRFTEYSSLYKHNSVHQQDRPYTCVICNQKFKQESAMSLHKTVKHNMIVAKDGIEILVDIN